MTEDYMELIDRALGEKSDALIPNRRPEHVRYLITKFLENARHAVRIYSGSLPCYAEDDGKRIPVYADAGLLHAAREFLRKEGSLLMVVTERDLDEGEHGDHPLIRMAEELGKDLNGTLWVAKASEKPEAASGEPRHWQVMDEEAYRLEHDRSDLMAHVNFGTPGVAGDLARRFNIVVRYAQPTKVVSAG